MKNQANVSPALKTVTVAVSSLSSPSAPSTRRLTSDPLSAHFVQKETPEKTSPAP